jgi:hypothetical protein
VAGPHLTLSSSLSFISPPSTPTTLTNLVTMLINLLPYLALAGMAAEVVTAKPHVCL